MNTLAIIPARIGSKRIPHKNIRDFCGSPMIAYPLRAAQASQLFSDIHVSTDDRKVADVAASEGCAPDFLRKPELADDFTPLLDVISWVLAEYKRRNRSFDAVCLIYATAPFLTPEILLGSHGVFEANQHQLPVVSVAQLPVPPEWSLRKDSNGKLMPDHPEALGTRSQDLGEAYYEAAMFVWLPVSLLENNFSGSIYPAVGYEIVREHAIEIDTLADWQAAERAYRKL